jgi:pimeloyl-ACP methyl ester carboxylesterase
MVRAPDAVRAAQPPETPLRPPAREQARATYPHTTGFVERNGVKVFYEVYGSGDPTVLLLPTWSLIHSRHWKMQIPDLARRCRVITFDGRGNGRSDRPAESAAYDEREFAADALAVMDATATEQAVIVGLSLGGVRGLILAADHPDRVAAAVFICPVYRGGGEPLAERAVYSWEDELDTDDGWAKYNKHAWVRDYRGFLEFFFSRMFTEPHSTKPIEDCVGWGLETTGATLVTAQYAAALSADEAREVAARVRCPVLVIQGSDDGIISPTRGMALAEHTGGRLAMLDGSSHGPHVRDPVKVNLLIRDFIAPPSTVPPWVRGKSRPKRALYISSPIGLGHAQRDAAIAAELRKLHPDLEIDWLAQHPVTAVLETRGERIHPRSAELASESAHIAAESSGHDLNAFQAIRRMDEILVSNFMVFHDAVTEGEYDLVIGDEAWDIDYYLHENPELKRTAFAWMTDFVGWLPMPDGGEREAYVTADYNAEMIEHIARFPRIRDRAIFVGEPDDIVPDDFGPGLGPIRDWTERHFAFSGYITGFDPAPLVEGRDELRRELGYQPDERVVIVTVGGSGVGEALLERVIASYPDAARRVNGLRMIAVAGPRIDPATLGAPKGVEVRAFVPDLYRHLAACDLAVVQGGLTTTMELAAARRPFLYFPLRYHFEQNRHVRHRLERYGAGRHMDFATSTPEVIAEAIAAEIDRPIDSRPVETDGAARAAALIAPLI